MLTEDPILNTADGLRRLLATPTFTNTTRSLASLRTKVRDIERQLDRGIGGL